MSGSASRHRGLRRFAVILLGYLVACYVAGVTLQLIIALDHDGAGLDYVIRNLPGLFASPIIMAPVIAVFAAIPAAFAIAAGEMIPRRDWPFYTVGGFLAGGLILGFFTLMAGVDATGQNGVDLLFATIMLCGGTAAGFAYWLVAGRGAGTPRNEG